jgi:S-formylglutathione hydrolase FrmB
LAIERRLLIGSIAAGSLAAGGLWLARRRPPPPTPDRPRLFPGVRSEDVAFHSPALQRTMRYRVLMPAAVTGKLPVVYLLHGGGGSFHDWTNYTDVARFARDLLLIAPQGDYSYYTNAAARPKDRYESYLLDDLPADVQGRFPVQEGRAGRALVGVSMGGYGALKAALRRPQQYGFVGGLSTALDVTQRPFAFRRFSQWRAFEGIFGPAGSATRLDNDPFALASAADPKALPFLHLTCGVDEPLIEPNRAFAALLARRGIAHQLHEVPGGHDWRQWDAQLAPVFASLRQHAGN